MMLYAGLRLVEEGGPGVSDAELERALLDVEPGCSGAMFGATKGAVRFIAKNGWDEYARRMTRE